MIYSPHQIVVNTNNLMAHIKEKIGDKYIISVSIKQDEKWGFFIVIGVSEDMPEEQLQKIPFAWFGSLVKTEKRKAPRTHDAT